MKKTRVPTFVWKRKAEEDRNEESVAKEMADEIGKWLDYLPCPMTFWKHEDVWHLKEIPPELVVKQLGYGRGPLIYSIKIDYKPSSECFIADRSTGEKRHKTTLNGNLFCINHSLTFTARRSFYAHTNTEVSFYFSVPDVSMAKACEAIGDYMSTTRYYNLSPYNPKHALDAIDSSDRLLKSLDITPTHKYMHEKSRYKVGEVIREVDRLLIETIDPATVCYIRTLLPATFNNMRVAEESGRFSLYHLL